MYILLFITVFPFFMNNTGKEFKRNYYSQAVYQNPGKPKESFK